MGENGREPSLEEIAKRMELPPGRGLPGHGRHCRTHFPVRSGVFRRRRSPHCDGPGPGHQKNTDERWIERIALRDAFQTLSEREKQILILRFYDGKTQMEVAGQVGISQAQVSRLREKRHWDHSEKM